jgi:CysZ protein
VAFFLACQGAILLLGVVVPGAQLVTVPAMTVLTVFFLALDAASYALDRRGLGFREKLVWARRNLAATAPFGLAAFLFCAVPVVNLVALPVLVIGGTLLVLRGDVADGT